MRMDLLTCVKLLEQYPALDRRYKKVCYDCYASNIGPGGEKKTRPLVTSVIYYREYNKLFHIHLSGMVEKEHFKSVRENLPVLGVGNIAGKKS